MPRMAIAVLLATIPTVVLSCGSGVGGNNDYEILENPIFNMDMSPPVAWSFFPALPAGATAAPTMPWYFVGQSNTTIEAKKNADTAITAAMIEAMAQAQIPVYNVEVTNDYQPEEFENPMAMSAIGGRYGKVEGGALTGFATTPTAVANTAIPFAPYVKTIDVTIRNARATRYAWNQVKNTFLQKMSLNYNAKFSGDVTVNSF